MLFDGGLFDVGLEATLQNHQNRIHSIGEGGQDGGNCGTAINGGTANGASGSGSDNGKNAGNDGIAIGAGSVANGNGNGQVGGLALNGGHTHPGCSDVIGSLCFDPRRCKH